MRLYPGGEPQRTRALVRDGAVLACLVVLAWLGIKVHDELAATRALGQGVVSTGASVRSGFASAATAVRGLPLVGGQLSHGLSQAGDEAAVPVIRAGDQTERDISGASNTLGWLVFGIPAALILGLYLPTRIRQVRTMSAAARVLGPSADEDRRRLIAQRAAFSLPYGQLLRYSDDPLGDLAAGRYEPLIAALRESAGM